MKPLNIKYDRKTEMKHILERMLELEDLVRMGKNAEESLKELNKEFKELCRLELEGED